MASMTVNCGSFNKTSYSGVTQYGALVNFTIPDGAVISACSVSFTTHAAGGDTADRAFSINGARAHSGWASNGSLYAHLLMPGNNTFRVTLKSQTPSGSGGTSCIWNISGITLTITYNESGGGYSPPVGGGGPVVITPSAIDAGAGSVTVTCPAEAGIWHLINWSFGPHSGQWSHRWETGGTGTIDIPLSWISEMPNATQGTLAIRVRRSTTPAEPYSYASDQTTNVIINVPASVVPTVSAFTETLDANGVPGAISGYVQGKSKVSLAVSATAGSYSSLASVRITGGGIDVYAWSGTFGPFNYAGDIVFTATAMDTRGRSASRQVAISVMPYSAPAFSTPEAWRSNYDGVKNQKGTYVRLKSGASFSSLEGQNAVSLKGRVYIKGGAATAWETMTPDTELILGGGALLFTRTYIAQIEVSDLLESRVMEFIIPTKKTGFSIMAGMKGAAVGKVSEIPDIFESPWPIVAPGLAPNPNLLHNSDFRAPINQRGVSGAISTGTYFYDRWMRNSGTVTTNADYLAIGASAVIEQRIEGSLLAGKTVTVSVEAGGTVYSGTGTMPTSAGTVSVTLTGWGTAALGYATEYMYVRLSPTAASDVQAVKLEMGTVSTLYMDPPMDKAVELLKCQRLLYVIGGNSYSRVGIAPVIYSTTVVGIMLPIPTSMRVSPTPSLIGNWGLYNFTTDALVSNVTSVSTTSSQMSSNLLSIEFLGSGLTNGAWYAIHARNDANAKILLSAEL